MDQFRNFSRFALSVFFCCITLGCASHRLNPWRDVLVPTKRMPESIGSYAGGCLQGGISISPDGPGFKVMRISRRRYYAHPSFVQFVERLGRKIKDEKLGVLLVGDLAQPRGGLSIPGHRSHQNGLDGDFWYLLPLQENLTLDDRETLQASSVVRTDDSGLNESWGDREREILRLASSENDVERIFVSPWIKIDLCSRFKGQSWLGKIRPWWGHSDHFHVRLKCPSTDKRCIQQAPVSIGDGCDSTLNWWFTEEAKSEGTRTEVASPEIVAPGCETVLGD